MRERGKETQTKRERIPYLSDSLQTKRQSLSVKNIRISYVFGMSVKTHHGGVGEGERERKMEKEREGGGERKGVSERKTGREYMRACHTGVSQT